MQSISDILEKCVVEQGDLIEPCFVPCCFSSKVQRLLLWKTKADPQTRRWIVVTDYNLSSVPNQKSGILSQLIPLEGLWIHLLLRDWDPESGGLRTKIYWTTKNALTVIDGTTGIHEAMIWEHSRLRAWVARIHVEEERASRLNRVRSRVLESYLSSYAEQPVLKKMTSGLGGAVFLLLSLLQRHWSRTQQPVFLEPFLSDHRRTNSLPFMTPLQEWLPLAARNWTAWYGTPVLLQDDLRYSLIDWMDQPGPDEKKLMDRLFGLPLATYAWEDFARLVTTQAQLEILLKVWPDVTPLEDPHYPDPITVVVDEVGALGLHVIFRELLDEADLLAERGALQEKSLFQQQQDLFEAPIITAEQPDLFRDPVFEGVWIPLPKKGQLADWIFQHRLRLTMMTPEAKAIATFVLMGCWEEWCTTRGKVWPVMEEFPAFFQSPAFCHSSHD